MENNILSQCPIVKDETLHLVEKFHINHVKKPFFADFEKEILWIKESESQVTYWHGDILFKNGSEYSDYYGLFTSVKSAITEAEELCAKFKITKDSSLEMRVTNKISLRPVMIDDSEESKQFYNGKTKSYLPIVNDWFYYDEAIIKEYIDVMSTIKVHDYDSRFAIHEKLAMNKLQNKYLAQDVIMWSSREDKTSFREQFINFYSE